MTARGPKVEEVLALAKCAPIMVVCPEAAVLQAFLVHALLFPLLLLLLFLFLFSLLLQCLLSHFLLAISDVLQYDLQVDAFTTAKAAHSSLMASFSGLGEEQGALALTTETSETVALITALAAVLKLPLPRCI